MVVISLGGSIVAGREIDVKYIQEFRQFLREESRQRKIFVVVGGGATARKYIAAGKELGLDQFTLDEIGVLATRLNAHLLLGGYSYPMVAKSVEEACAASSSYNVVVMGGTEPGHTTDAVSLLLAEKLGEKRVINMTSVGGIYDKDPRKYKDARLIRRMSYQDAKNMFMKEKMNAGLNIPFDLLSLKIAERSGIEIVIVGREIATVKEVINGGNYQGTVIGNPNIGDK